MECREDDMGSGHRTLCSHSGWKDWEIVKGTWCESCMQSGTHIVWHWKVRNYFLIDIFMLLDTLNMRTMSIAIENLNMLGNCTLFCFLTELSEQI